MHEEVGAPVLGGTQQVRELRGRIDLREAQGVRDRNALRRGQRLKPWAVLPQAAP